MPGVRRFFSKEDKMKRHTIGATVAICTFAIGVIAAAAWLIKPASTPSQLPPQSAEADAPAPPAPKATPDSTVYTVSFCDLIRNPQRYDQKLVRVKAVYGSGIDTSALSDPSCKRDDAWARDSCPATDVSCDEVYKPIEEALRSSPSFEAEVDVVGRYVASAEDPALNQTRKYVHMLEIREVKSAKPVKRSR